MRAAIATILVAVLLGRVARADDDAERTAQAHLDRGIAAFGAGDFEVARRELQAAIELVPHKPNPYRWLALTEIQQGNCAHARLEVDSFLARVAPDDARIPELLQRRDACKPRGAPRVTTAPATVAPPAAPVRDESPSIVTRWWFWAAIGVTATAITAATWHATRGDEPTVLPPVLCDASGCRPGGT